MFLSRCSYVPLVLFFKERSQSADLEVAQQFSSAIIIEEEKTKNIQVFVICFAIECIETKLRE